MAGRSAFLWRKDITPVEPWRKTMSSDLSGRTVLITGASSGLGKHFAKIASAAVAMDVEDEASVIAGFDAAEKALGPIDSVIANAGMNHRGMALDLAVAD